MFCVLKQKQPVTRDFTAEQQTSLLPSIFPIIQLWTTGTNDTVYCTDNSWHNFHFPRLDIAQSGRVRVNTDADRASPGPMSTILVILHWSRDTLPTVVNVKCSVTEKDQVRLWLAVLLCMHLQCHCGWFIKKNFDSKMKAELNSSR